MRGGGLRWRIIAKVQMEWRIIAEVQMEWRIIAEVHNGRRDLMPDVEKRWRGR